MDGKEEKRSSEDRVLFIITSYISTSILNFFMRTDLENTSDFPH